MSEGEAVCDGHEYEDMFVYDLQDPMDYMAFEGKLDLFMGLFDRAEEVYADEESGHQHFYAEPFEVKCNIEKRSDRYREIYWTVETGGFDANAAPSGGGGDD